MTKLGVLILSFPDFMDFSISPFTIDPKLCSLTLYISLFTKLLEVCHLQAHHTHQLCSLAMFRESCGVLQHSRHRIPTQPKGVSMHRET